MLNLGVLPSQADISSAKESSMSTLTRFCKGVGGQVCEPGVDDVDEATVTSPFFLGL